MAPITKLLTGILFTRFDATIVLLKQRPIAHFRACKPLQVLHYVIQQGKHLGT